MTNNNSVTILPEPVDIERARTMFAEASKHVTLSAEYQALLDQLLAENEILKEAFGANSPSKAEALLTLIAVPIGSLVSDCYGTVWKKSFDGRWLELVPPHMRPCGGVSTHRKRPPEIRKNLELVDGLPLTFYASAKVIVGEG